jgi:thiosulfate dehydrogenase (quinone) large subunit
MVAKKSNKSGDTGNSVWYAVAVVRVLLGITFLWAFFDKLFGLGYSTVVAKAWINGGSPTTGFLKSVHGPFADAFNAMAGQPWADWLFMIGLLGIGLGLLFGIAVRLSVITGSVLLLLMWMASLPIKTNPVIDDHIVYIVVLLIVASGLEQQKWSLAAWGQKQSLVKSNYWLK